MTKKRKTIVAKDPSPAGLAGECPKCKEPMFNPTRQERCNLSMYLCWTIICKGCQSSVTIMNPRFVPEGGDHATGTR